MANMQRDFTTGKVSLHLIAFAWPILLSNLVQSFYNLADTLIISYYIGESGIAAINSGSQIMAVLINVVTGLCLGGSVIVARCFGKGDWAKLEQAVGTVFSVVMAFAVVVTAVLLLFARRFLQAVQTPVQVMDSAVSFLIIYSLAIPFLFGYNAISAVLRGVGNSQMALLFVMISTICNLGLDLLFVAVWGWGTDGAAAATTISIFLCFICALFYFARQKGLFQFRRGALRVHKQFATRFLAIGFPSALQQSIFGLSILIMTGFVNRYGVAAAAILGIGMRIDHFAVQPTHAISNAETSMVAQNLGAGKIERTQKIVQIALALQVAIALMLLVLTQMFAPKIIRIFSQESEIIRLGTIYLRLVCIDYVFVAGVRAFNGLAVGAGNSVFPLAVTIMNGFIFRVPIALFCERALGMGLTGLFLGFGLANLGGATAGYLYYRKGYWKKAAQASEE